MRTGAIAFAGHLMKNKHVHRTPKRHGPSDRTCNLVNINIHMPGQPASNSSPTARNGVYALNPAKFQRFARKESSIFSKHGRQWSTSVRWRGELRSRSIRVPETGTAKQKHPSPRSRNCEANASESQERDRRPVSSSLPVSRLELSRPRLKTSFKLSCCRSLSMSSCCM